MIKLFYFDSLGSKVCYKHYIQKISRQTEIIIQLFLDTFCYFLYFFYLCKSDILALTLIYTQLNFDSQGIKVKFYFLAAYYRGFGIHPIFSRGLGIHTNKLYFPCRTNRMLALNSKEFKFSLWSSKWINHWKGNTAIAAIEFL